jgi:mRNA interferase MazF
VLRGEIWSYIPQGSPRQPLVVIVSSDGINQSARTWLLGAPISPDDPQDILAVQIEDCGWVSAGNVTRLYRGWLRERVGELDAPIAEQLNSALRAAFDL